MTEDARTEHLDETALDRLRTGELPEPDRARAAAHVEACPECARALAELEELADVVGRAYAADRAATGMGDPEWARLRARVGEAVGAAEAPRAGKPAAESAARRRAWSRWMPQAAAAVVALLVLGVLWREGFRGPEDAGRLAEPESGVTVSAPRIPFPETETLSTDGDAAQDMAAEEPLARDELAAGQAAKARENAAEEAAEAVGRQEAFRADAPPPAVPPDQVPREGDFGRRAEGQDRSRAAGVEIPRAEPTDADDLADAPAAAVSAPDPYYRFTIQARAALSTRDTAAARRTLSLWRDTLAPRAALEAERRRQATVLADSLAGLLAP